MNKAVIFDLDGTLWDSTHQILPAWNEYIAEQGYSYEFTHENACACMGKTTPQIAEMLFPELSPEEGLKLVQGCCEAEVKSLLKTGGTLYPALRETLTKLKEKYHVYIVSNCEDGYIQSFLTSHDFGDIVEDFECIGRTGKVKGENIKLVIARNNIDSAIYVGDTPSDYAATQIAGVPFVWASYGFGKVENVPHISTISEICEKADEMLK